MFEERPDEQTTLLAKEQRNYDAIREMETPPIEENKSSVPRFQSLRLCLVEPMILLLVFGYRLSSTVQKNQIIYQTCTAIYQFNASDCSSLTANHANEHTKHLEKLMQPYVARVFMTLDLLQCIVPALFGWCVGTWADRFGRKPLLVASFAGYGVSYLLMAVIADAATDNAISPWYFLLSILPSVLTGGSVTYSVAALCYIADVTPEHTRPYRMMLYEAAMYGGLVLGALASGYLYELGNSAVWVFNISAAVILLATLIIAAALPESLHLNTTATPSAQPQPQPDAQTVEEAPLQRGLCEIRVFKEIWECGFKRREFNDRSIIWLIIFTLLLSTFIVDGGGGVFYLYVRHQFNWTLRQYTNYDTLSVLTVILGNLFGGIYLRKWLKLSLISTAIYAFLSQTISCLLKAFALADWLLYLAVPVGMLRSLSNPMCRTVLTKIVTAQEYGKILSIHGTLQSLVPLLASPLYTLIYSITLSSFAGFFNLLSGNFCLLAIALLLAILHKKQNNTVHYATILN